MPDFPHNVRIRLAQSKFLYYEESLVSSNLNSKQLRFHCVRPNEDIKISFWKFLTSNPDADETPEAAVVNKRQSDKSSLLMNVTFSSGSSGRNKFDLVFQKESNVEIAKRRELAQQPYVRAHHMFPRILNLRFIFTKFSFNLFVTSKNETTN